MHLASAAEAMPACALFHPQELSAAFRSKPRSLEAQRPEFEPPAAFGETLLGRTFLRISGFYTKPNQLRVGA